MEIKSKFHIITVHVFFLNVLITIDTCEQESNAYGEGAAHDVIRCCPSDSNRLTSVIHALLKLSLMWVFCAWTQSNYFILLNSEHLDLSFYYTWSGAPAEIWGARKGVHDLSSPLDYWNLLAWLPVSPCLKVRVSIKTRGVGTVTHCGFIITGEGFLGPVVHHLFFGLTLITNH